MMELSQLYTALKKNQAGEKLSEMESRLVGEALALDLANQPPEQDEHAKL